MDESIQEHLVPVETLEEWQRLLLRAANLIETHGHCKHVTRDAAGRYCLIEAIAECGVSGFRKATSAIDDAVGRDCIEWNNAPERTAEEVISTMRRVALGG